MRRTLSLCLCLLFDLRGKVNKWRDHRDWIGVPIRIYNRILLPFSLSLFHSCWNENEEGWERNVFSLVFPLNEECSSVLVRCDFILGKQTQTKDVKQGPIGTWAECISFPRARPCSRALRFTWLVPWLDWEQAKCFGSTTVWACFRDLVPILVERESPWIEGSLVKNQGRNKAILFLV